MGDILLVLRVNHRIVQLAFFTFVAWISRLSLRNVAGIYELLKNPDKFKKNKRY